MVRIHVISLIYVHVYDYYTLLAGILLVNERNLTFTENVVVIACTVNIWIFS